MKSEPRESAHSLPPFSGLRELTPGMKYKYVRALREYSGAGLEKHLNALNIPLTLFLHWKEHEDDIARAAGHSRREIATIQSDIQGDMDDINIHPARVIEHRAAPPTPKTAHHGTVLQGDNGSEDTQPSNTHRRKEISKQGREGMAALIGRPVAQEKFVRRRKLAEGLSSGEEAELAILLQNTVIQQAAPGKRRFMDDVTKSRFVRICMLLRKKDREAFKEYLQNVKIWEPDFYRMKKKYGGDIPLVTEDGKLQGESDVEVNNAPISDESTKEDIIVTDDILTEDSGISEGIDDEVDEELQAVFRETLGEEPPAPVSETNDPILAAEEIPAPEKKTSRGGYHPRYCYSGKKKSPTTSDNCSIGRIKKGAKKKLAILGK